tara:strand:+ start:223 stop:537 length:315 start_codon:yes stop_codon:yes gene_type:complete
MRKKEMTFRDPVVERVCDKFVKRSDVGYAKYGKTLHDERTGKHKDLAGYLNDVQEELMDAILYIQAAREELRDKLVTDAIKAADHAAFHGSSAQLDWDDAISPV